MGEFSYELKGAAGLPPPLEKLRLTAEAEASGAKEVALPLRNPQMEKARALVLDRSVRSSPHPNPNPNSNPNPNPNPNSNPNPNPNTNPNPNPNSNPNVNPNPNPNPNPR